jgi:hypothetical protein
MPENALVEGDTLHPVLHNTTRFTKRILAKKEKNSHGKPPDEQLYKDAMTNPKTMEARDAMEK